MDKKTPHALVSALEQTLQQQLVLHRGLLDLLKRKRDVLRANDARATADLCGLEHEKVQKVAELEKQRLKLVADLTLRVDPAAAEPMRLAELAERLGEPARGRLLVLRQQLLEQMRRVQQETSVVRRATEALAKHMQGIVQTIGAISSGVSTYGSRGAFPQQNTAVSTFSATA
jgi:FlgN protein